MCSRCFASVPNLLSLPRGRNLTFMLRVPFAFAAPLAEASGTSRDESLTPQSVAQVRVTSYRERWRDSSMMRVDYAVSR